MSEHNTIYDLDGKIVGQFRYGVAWSKGPRERLGEYDDCFVYDNQGDVVAKFSDGVVLSIIGEPIGEFDNEDLIVEGRIVGRCIGLDEASAAAIALIFNPDATRGSS